MKPHHTLEEAQEWAALHALGALEEAEARQFAQHLQDGCGMCAAELGSFTEVTEGLALTAQSVRPSNTARTAVLNRFAAPVIEKDGVRFVRGDRIAWEPSSVPDVERKTLSVDAARNFTTRLIRMAPGSIFPSHRHAETEEVFVIEGDLTVCGVTMRAGDYCRAETRSIHEGIYTTNGCVFLVLYSQDNERL